MKVKDRAFGLKLIAAVKREPCLYAYFGNGHRESTVSNDARKGAWERVAGEMDLSVPDVKAKWNTMRDQYRKQRGKNQGEAWFYFQPMSFMAQYVKPGRNSMRHSLQHRAAAADGAESSEGSSYALLGEGAQAEPLIDGVDIHAMLSAIDHSWTQGVIKAELTNNVDPYDSAGSSGMEHFGEGNNGAITASANEDQPAQWGGDHASFQEALPSSSTDPDHRYALADNELQGMSFTDLQAEALRAQIRRDRAIAAYFEGIAKRQ